MALVEKIREKYPETPIFFSAYEDFEAARAEGYGVKQYILKPINWDSLKTVEGLLEEVA